MYFVQSNIQHISGFWGFRPRLPPGLCPGPRWETSVPQAPSFVPSPPVANSWLRPCAEPQCICIKSLGLPFSKISSITFQLTMLTVKPINQGNNKTYQQNNTYRHNISVVSSRRVHRPGGPRPGPRREINQTGRAVPKNQQASIAWDRL